MGPSAEAGPAVTVLLALGPCHDQQPSAIAHALSAIERLGDGELLIVDDRTPLEVRDGLALLEGPVRIRHDPHHVFGSSLALVAGAVCAKGSILVCTRAETCLDIDSMASLRAAFVEDPDLSVVQGTDETGRPVPVFAISARSLHDLGGPAALALGDEEDQSGALLPRTISDAISSGAIASRPVALCVRPPDEAPRTWASDTDVTVALARPFFEPVVHDRRSRPGVNVIGLLEAACGIGDAARRYVDALEISRIDYATYPFHFHLSPPFPFEHRGPRTMAFEVNLLALNAEVVPALAACAGLELWRDRYSIGLWFWELEEIGEAQRNGARYVNELWVATGFLNEAFSRSIEREVITVPLPVRRRDGEPQIDRYELKLPEDYVFLSMMDFGSLESRKNSMGAVRAFTTAFSPGEGPVLVLKTLNAGREPAIAARLDAAIGGRRDIVRIDDYLTDEAIAALVGNADCFVSLHRAEGFGLSLADAMAWGRPVIATGYSGNLEFMNDKNSYLVDYDLVPVPEEIPWYPNGARWAEPKVVHAARLMRHVYEHQGEADARGERARVDIRRSNSLEAAARVIEGRIEHLTGLRARARASAPHHRAAARRREAPSRSRR